MQREKTQHVSAFIKAFVKENHLEEGLLQCRVFDAWDDVLAGMSSGPVSREAAAKLTLSKHFKDGILTCRMNSSVLRMQMRMNSDSLLRKLNDRLGGPIVTKIVFQ